MGLLNNCVVYHLCIDSRQSILTTDFLSFLLSAVRSICVVVLAPKLPGCNPPSMTQPTWCVSTVERLPALALACGIKLLLAPVVCGHKGRTQQCHKNSSVTGCWRDFNTNWTQEQCRVDSKMGHCSLVLLLCLLAF